MRSYKAFYRGRSIEVSASGSYQAQVIAAAIFKAKKGWEVTVVLLDVAVDPASL